MSVIQVDNLVKHFGSTKAVDGISFSVSKGEVFGFLGPNGAGKTTTIRCLMDFIRPTSGTISILGKDAQQDSVELKKYIGFLSGNIRLNDHWTGKEHITFAHKLSGTKDNSGELMTMLDFDPSVKAKHLSSGNKQKLGIIMALVSNPEVLIMDEPTNALDPLLQQEIYKIIAAATERGSTVFMSSHNLAEVDKVCDRVGIIKHGKMVTVESIQSLKEKQLYTVHVHFVDKTDPQPFVTLGADVLDTHNHGIRMRIKGDMNPLVTEIGKHKIRDIEIEHATLEEIFLEYYQ